MNCWVAPYLCLIAIIIKKGIQVFYSDYLASTLCRWDPPPPFVRLNGRTPCTPFKVPCKGPCWTEINITIIIKACKAYVGIAYTCTQNATTVIYRWSLSTHMHTNIKYIFTYAIYMLLQNIDMHNYIHKIHNYIYTSQRSFRVLALIFYI